MLLYIADNEGEVLSCPKCDRELWPAYRTADRLIVGFHSGFHPKEGQAGLLVCGDLNCPHEEPITFTNDPQADAVVLNWEHTHMCFYDYDYASFPVAWIEERLEEVERVFQLTGRAKLGSAVVLYQEEIEAREDKIERWLAKATLHDYPVRFRLDEAKEEISGRIMGQQDEVFVLQTSEGEVRIIPKNLVWQEHITYPRRPRRERQRIVNDEGHWVGFPLSDDRYIVVEGHHLSYGGGTELGDRVTGRCWDPEVAAALRLKEEAPGYWEGAFTVEEMERFYQRHDYVLIRGHWVEECSRIEKPPYVWVKTEDAAVAAALGMEPYYGSDADEFGSWETDEIIYYWEYFPSTEIEAERWEEELLTFPPIDWPH